MFLVIFEVVICAIVSSDRILHHDPIVLSLRTQQSLFDLSQKFRGVIVKYYNQQCMQCMSSHEIYAQFGEEYVDSEDIMVCEVDCDYSEDICTINRVHTFPAIHLYIDGKDREYEGIETVEGITTFVENYLSVSQRQPIFDINQTSSVAGFHSFKEFEALRRFYHAVLVKYFDPSSTQCISMAPTFERLRVHCERSDVYVAEINCREHQDTCISLNIHVLPTIILYIDGSSLEYHGNLELTDMMKFVDRYVKPRALDDILLINTQSVFEEAIRSSSKAVLVSFFTSESLNAVAFCATLDRLIQAYLYNEKMKFVLLDCTRNDLCRSNGVFSFPTVRMYSKDHWTMYSGDYALKSLKEFVDAEIKK